MSEPEHRTYVFENRIPTLPEHRFLSDQVGWADSFRWSAMAASLAGSCCGTVVFDPTGHLVGMGRVVGDGAFFFYLQDIAVAPDHRGAGLGAGIIDRLLDQIVARAGGDAFVGLFATDRAGPVYRRAGFTCDAMTGMWQMLRSAR